MALTQLDYGLIEEQVMRLLADDSVISGGIEGLIFVARGRPQPGSDVPVWARLVRVDVQDAEAGRQMLDTEPARGRVTVVMNVCARPGAIIDDAYVLSWAMGVTAAMLRERRIRDVSAKQTLVLEGAEARQDGESDDDRGLQTGVVIATGWAERVP